jgi:hypothetical protein
MTPDRRERERTVAAATTAHRARDAEGAIVVDAAWLDLDEAGRRAAFAETVHQRALEAALDPQGLSTTGRAVLARIVKSRP